MNLEDRIKVVDAIDFVSEKDSNAYAMAYTSFYHDLRVIQDLNKLIERLFGELEKQATKRVLSKELEQELINYAVRLVKTNRILKKKSIKKPYLTIEPQKEFQKLLNEKLIREQGINVIHDMSVIYLISLFESYLQKILQASFEKKPEILKTCQKNITYEELLENKTIAEAKLRIMEKETEMVNKGIENIKEYFKRKFNIELSEFVDWKEFTERFYRRNIITHNSGFPNKLYRAKTGYSGDNKKLIVSMSYLESSFDLFNKMSQKIGLALEEKIIGYRKMKK